MPENGVAMWPNETRDLIDISAADYSELYPAITCIKKIGDTGSGGPGVELHAGIVPLPELDLAVQFVIGHFTEILSPRAEGKDRRVTQLGLFDRLRDNVVVTG